MLLDAHDREVRDALGGVDLSGVDATPWRELLRCQHELLDELRASRDEAAQALAQLGRDRRGARAYRESTA